jgi:hypothetical protein
MVAAALGDTFQIGAGAKGRDGASAVGRSTALRACGRSKMTVIFCYIFTAKMLGITAESD